MRAEQWIRVAVGCGLAFILLSALSLILLRFSSATLQPKPEAPVILSTTTSPDTRIIVEMLSNDTAAVRTDDNALIGIVRGHSARLIAAEFLTDGRLLTIDQDGTRIVTDVAHLRLREAVHGADIAQDVSGFLWRSVLEVPAETAMALNARYSPLSPGRDRFDPEAKAPVLSAGFEPFVGTVFRDCEMCPEMVATPAGTFQYGSPIDDPERLDNEQFRSLASVERPLAVGRFEVTRGEYRRFVEETGYPVGGDCRVDPGATGSPASEPDATFLSPGFDQTDSHPVVCVSWQDAMEYTRWLSDATGHAYRLLADVEWEFISRAGAQSPYWWGREPSRRFANFGSEVCCNGVSDGPDLWLNTAPVGSFPPNAFGVFESQGNVYEWTDGCFRAPNAAVAPNDDEFCENRTARGGSWSDNPKFLRAAARYGTPGNGRHHDVGFRIARDLRD